MNPHRASIPRSARLAVLAKAFRVILLVPPILVTQGCGGSSGASGEATRAPAKSGDVWVIANPDDRASAPGAVLAYIHGLHAFVLDGNDAYLGMTRHAARKGEEGSRILTLPGAGDIRILSVGDSLELRFPGGETLPLQKQRSFQK